MDFRIADSFIGSLARPNGAEQKAAKTTAFDLQLNASAPGLRFHRLDRARDPNFWSVRVNDDIRLIVHRTATSLMLCFVGHHDSAYAWAERRKIERHPVTGAAQLVELPERVEPTAVPLPTTEPAVSKPLLFAGIADQALLGYGVPLEWLGAVRAADEDSCSISPAICHKRRLRRSSISRPGRRRNGLRRRGSRSTRLPIRMRSAASGC